MSASSTTKNLNLPIFAAEDIPTWQGDWNQTMETLDEAIGKEQINVVQGTGTSTTDVMSQNATTMAVNQVRTDLSANIGNKQDKLVSGTNIKTINGQDITGGGNLEVNPSVYFAKTDSSVTVNEPDSPGQTVLTLRLPAGTYRIDAHAFAQNLSASLICIMGIGSSIDAESCVTLSGANLGGGGTTFKIVTLSSEQNVTLKITSTQSVNFQATMIATPINKLN